MMHHPLLLQDISLCFPEKTCFEHFTGTIHPGSRIAIMGRNGCGKSTLLKMLMGLYHPSSGELCVPGDAVFGCVPQVIDNYDTLSGGQRFNKSLTAALAQSPNILLLDEPTNHLDARNKKKLLRLLNHFYGTLIIVTHDEDVLRNCVDTLWHIDHGHIVEFSGRYDDYIQETDKKRHALEKNMALLNRKKHGMHASLMKEQKRAAKSKSKGQKSIEQKKWPTVVSQAKFSRSEQTSGKKKSAIDENKNRLTEQLSALRSPKVIVPKFQLLPSEKARGVLVAISYASIAYATDKPLIKDIHISLSAQDKMAIIGDNGSGKSTLLKALLNFPDIIKTGQWCIPNADAIGYLDQHYANVPPNKTVLQALSDLVPAWEDKKIRYHLNDFLFKSNQDVNSLGKALSGGEKTRLSLAMIAAKPPNLLILDEITNNLDLETKQHVMEVLQSYPGALMVVSHDMDFLKKIHIDITMEVKQQTLKNMDSRIKK
jgi:ATPase subunit of ABC transporter with duplicated ATPase domains